MKKRINPTGKQFHTYYSKLLLYFVALAASCVLLLGALLSIFFFYKLNVATASYNQALLANARLEVQKNVESVQASVQQLGLHKLINKYRNPNTTPDYMEINNINQMLIDMVGAHDSLDSVYVVYPKRNLTISSHGVYSESMFVDRDWLPLAEASPNRLVWLEQRSIRKDILSQASTTVITLVSKMPIPSSSHVGYIVVNVKESFVKSKLASLQHDDVHLVIESKSGGLISVSNNITEQQYLTQYRNLENPNQSTGLVSSNGEYYIATKSICGITDWTFLAYTPINTFLQDYLFSTAMIIVSTLLVIGISFVIATVLRHKMYRPIEQLIQSINQPQPNSQNYDYTEFKQISLGLMSIAKEREELSIRINQTIPSLRDNFLTDLMSGRITDAHLLDEYLEMLNLPIKNYGRFTVLVLRLDETVDVSGEEYVLYLLAISNHINTLVQSMGCFCRGVERDIRTAHFVLGFPVGANVNDVIATVGESALNLARQTFPFTVTIGAGNPVESLQFLQVSANQASESLDKSFIYGHDQIICFRNIEKDSACGYINPLTFENRLTNAVRAHNIEDMNHMLSDIYDLIFQNLDDIRLIRQFYLSIINIVFIMENDLSDNWDECGDRLNLLVNQVYRTSSMIEMHELARSICITTADKIESQRTCRTKQVVQNILDFLDTNYASEISLDTIAELVSYTPTYINKILRSSCQKTFYDILTDIRMQKSEELLSGTELQIYQIAERVGYHNVQSFIRMFKKTSGITPGAYREKMQSPADKI